VEEGVFTVLSPDNVIAGRYRIVAIIGQGSYGKVYLGHDAELDRDVAIKELQRSTESGSEELWAAYQQRFRKEAHILSRFSHPNVVIAYGLEQDDAGDMYLILEYVDGKSLKELLESGKPLSTDQALSIAIDIGQAIEAIYKRDIVHRDIKPGNILVGRDGSAKLTDFGVAQVGHETHRTQEAVGHPGTPAYKSPEQATSSGYLDQRSDLYSLGLVLYEMLTGQLYVRNHLPPHQYNPHVPAALDAVVMKALQGDPAQRYQTATEMCHDLEQVRRQDTLGQLRIVLDKLPMGRYMALFGAVVLLFALLGIYRLASVISGATAMIDLTPTAAAAAPTVVPTPTWTMPPPTATPSLMPSPTPSPSPSSSPTPDDGTRANDAYG
jgi:serine/threonine protein kinase